MEPRFKNLIQPNTQEANSAAYIVKQWSKFMLKTNRRFNITNQSDLKRAYDDLVRWTQFAGNISYIRVFEDAQLFLSSNLNITLFTDLADVFTRDNWEELHAAGYWIPAIAPSKTTGKLEAMKSEIHGSIKVTQQAAKNSTTPAEDVDATVPTKVYRKKKRSYTKDTQSWRAYTIPTGIPVDRRKNSRAWFVCYDAANPNTPHRMYPVEPGKEGKAIAETGIPYNTAIHHQYSEDEKVELLNIRMMLLKTYIMRDGKPITKNFKKAIII